MKNIIYKHQGVLSAIYYLMIEGGQGHGKKHYGSKYHFVGTYMNPNELEDRNNISLEVWCEQKNIPYVFASTFNELVEKLEKFDRDDIKNEI